jgi:tetratricopeptide (TPR) repeat protein
MSLGLLLLLNTSLMAAEDSTDSLIIRGNEAYSEGLYSQSIEYYLQVIDLGFESPELYFNLGNSYFKMNNIPEAILNYEKAKKLDPRNEDILYNLSLANSRIIDKIEAVPELFYITWWKKMKSMVNTDSWARAGIVMSIIFWVCVLIFFISGSVTLKKISFWSGLLMLLLVVVSFLVANQKYNYEMYDQHGIIFTPTVTVKSSPNENSVDLFVIHEGTKVTITDEVEGWKEIRIADGSQGWIRVDTFRLI